MTELATSYEDFSRMISEARDAEALTEALVTAKRKYTADHPALKVSTSAPVRSRVLAFVAEHKKVSKGQLKEFFKSLSEETGRRPSWGWVRKNANLIDSEIDEKSGETFFSLTKRGQRVLEIHKNFEAAQKVSGKKISESEEVVEEVATDDEKKTLA